MNILADKIAKFENNIDPKEWINLIELASTSYPLESVSRRPHLTMELPNLASESDSIESINLRTKLLNVIYSPIKEYMNQYNISNMELKKDFITVSKLLGGGMKRHRDDRQVDSDNFICMFYINDDYDGGEISFPDHDIVYKPKSGDILIYQSKFMHEVLPMSGNPRYNIGIGFRGPIC